MPVVKDFKNNRLVPPTAGDKRSTIVSPGNLWIYGWTHYGMTGQTRARMNKLTREIQIKEQNQWMKYRSGCDRFFTSARHLITITSFALAPRRKKRTSTSAQLAENSQFFA